MLLKNNIYLIDYLDLALAMVLPRLLRAVPRMLRAEGLLKHNRSSYLPRKYNEN